MEIRVYFQELEYVQSDRGQTVFISYFQLSGNELNRFLIPKLGISKISKHFWGITGEMFE